MYSSHSLARAEFELGDFSWYLHGFSWWKLSLLQLYRNNYTNSSDTGDFYFLVQGLL